MARGKKLGEILLERGVIDADQSKSALDYAKRWGIPFGQACVKMGFVDEATVAQGLAEQMGAPSVSLKGVTPAAEILAKLTPEQAEKYRAVPISLTGGTGQGPGEFPGGARTRGPRTLVVAVSSSRELSTLDEMAFVTGHRISPVIATDSDVDEALFRLYGRDVQRHTKSSTMVDLELEAFQNGDGDVGELVHDPLRLALDFLPTVSITR